MAGPNLNGTGLFGGFIDPQRREEMQQRRKRMPLNQALTPQKPGTIQDTSVKMPSSSASIFKRFGNGY